MKKILTFLTAVLFAVGGVNAQKEEPLKMSRVSGWSFDFVNVYENFTVRFNGTTDDKFYFYKLIGANNSINKADYKGLEVLFERAESENSCAKLRVCYNNGPWNKFLVPGETTLSINFEEDKRDVVPDVLDDIIIQIDPGAENASIPASVFIKKINLIKHNDTKEQLKSCDGSGWETSVLVEPMESATLKIPGRWSSIEFVDYLNNKLSYNKNNNEKHFITVDLEEPSIVDFQTLDESGAPATYPGGFSANDGRTSFVFTPTYIDGYNELRMQATTIDINDKTISEGDKSSAISYPQQIKVKSVKRGIIYPTSTATPNSKNTACWGTYSNNLANVELSGDDGVEVYNVTNEGKKLKFTRRANNKVAKGEGVIVKCGGGSFNVEVINDEVTAAAANENLLKATPTTVQKITSTEEKLYYLTKNTDGKLGFYWRAADGKSLPDAVPGKAYLAIPNTYQLSKTRSIDIDDPETTDIEGVTAERVQHDAIYNLAGQRVGKLSKGINIVGNKKVLVK